MPIYTKKGDKGKTSLFNGTICNKNDPRCNAYGTVDELNSVLGIIVSELGIRNYELRMKEELINIQNDLLAIGSNLANPAIKKDIEFSKKLEKQVLKFENYIDEMTEQMPVLKNFILPGGGRVGAFLHLSRTVSRRTEREIVGLSQKEKINPSILVYTNRLSDLFFTMSRFINFKEKQKETIWKQ